MAKRLNLDEYATLINHLIGNRQKYQSMDLVSILKDTRNCFGSHVSESSVRSGLRACAIEYRPRKIKYQNDRVGAIAKILLHKLLAIQDGFEHKVNLLSDDDVRALEAIISHKKVES